MKNIKTFEEFYYSDITNMTKELAKEMLEFLDKNGEHALVKEYKHKVSDNIISSIIGIWATSNEPLEKILDEYWERHLKIYDIKENLTDVYKNALYLKSSEKVIKHWNSLNVEKRKDIYKDNPESGILYDKEFSQQNDLAKVQIVFHYMWLKKINYPIGEKLQF